MPQSVETAATGYSSSAAHFLAEVPEDVVTVLDALDENTYKLVLFETCVRFNSYLYIFDDAAAKL